MEQVKWISRFFRKTMYYQVGIYMFKFNNRSISQGVKYVQSYQ